MFDQTPIELLIEQLGADSFMRTRAHLQQFANTPTGHLNKWAQIINRLNIKGETDILESTLTLNRPYNVNIVSLTTDTKEIIIIYKNREMIYKQSYSLPGSASIFQAELEAIRQAASFFNGNKIR